MCIHVRKRFINIPRLPYNQQTTLSCPTFVGLPIMSKRAKMDIPNVATPSASAGAMVPNINAKIQQLYFQFLSDPLNEAQLLMDKKLLDQGIDPLSVVPLSRQSLDDESPRESFESRSPTPNSRPSTPPPCSPASSPSSSPRRSLFSAAARKRKKSLGKSPLATSDENSFLKFPDELPQKLPLSPRENFVSERRPNSPTFRFFVEKEEVSLEPQLYSEVAKVKPGLSLEKKVLQSVGQRSNYNSNNNNSNSSNIVNGSSSTLSKSKSSSACEPKLSGSTFASVTPLKLDDQFNGTIPSVTPSSGDAAAIGTSSLSTAVQETVISPRLAVESKTSPDSASNSSSTTETFKRVDPDRPSTQKKSESASLHHNQQQQQRSQPLRHPPPRFYFPRGRPNSAPQLQRQRRLLSEVTEIFNKFENGVAQKSDFGEIIRALCMPLYWKSILFRACGGFRNSFVTLGSLTTTWNQLWDHCGIDDEPAQFVFLLRSIDSLGSNESSSSQCCSDYLTESDLTILVQDVVDTHPGLLFLHDSPAFISRYVTTVVSRITYCVNSSWSEHVTLRDLRHDLDVKKGSSFLAAVRQLEETDDINSVTEFFSYEHFYVIYCKFWELDRDHDLKISKSELAGYNNHSISDRMIDRIFSAAVNRTNPNKTGQMCFQDFVWFILSSEDKRTTKAIEFWFRCMDLDGDGRLSMYELEYFYEEQLRRLEAMCIEPLSFENLLCQMLDLIHPADPNFVTLVDLKRKMELVHIFFDTFFDLEKYLEHENKDSFAVAAQKTIGPDGKALSEWEKFALDQYRILVTEDDNDGNENDDVYEDDFEVDELTIEEELKVGMEGDDDATSDPVQEIRDAQNIRL